MARIINVPLPGVGHDEFTIYPDMFLVDGVSPEAVRLYASGVFYNCTRLSDTVLHIDNPTSEPATFTFEIEYRVTMELPWTYTSGWHQVGTRYKSLGHTPMHTSLMRNSISGLNNKIGSLSISDLINPYSKYKSDKISAHGQGEWRLYTHTMPGGVAFDYELWVEQTIGGVYTLTGKTTGIPWLYSYKLLGWLATRWVALTGKPYTYTKLVVHDVTGDPVALVSGGRGTALWSGALTNNSDGGTATYYIKSYHCDTIGGTYVEGNSLTVTVNLDGKPWSVTNIVVSRPFANTCRIAFNWTGTPGQFRFKAKDLNDAWQTIDFNPGEDGNELEELVSDDNFNANPSLIAWQLWVYYATAWRKEADNVV